MCLSNYIPLCCSTATLNIATHLLPTLLYVLIVILQAPIPLSINGTCTYLQRHNEHNLLNIHSSPSEAAARRSACAVGAAYLRGRRHDRSRPRSPDRAPEYQSTRLAVSAAGPLRPAMTRCPHPSCCAQRWPPRAAPSAVERCALR